MNNLIYGIILSALPIAELRGGVPLAMSSGAPIWMVFILCVLANILIIPVVFFFLDFLHERFMGRRFYRVLFSKIVNRTRKKIEHRIGTKWEYPALLLLVAIPFPGTGAYAGSLAAWLFKLNRKKSLITIALGVLIAGVLVTFASLGIYSLI
ncbi:small multi-drug export protein [Candidatus Woesearchaeota archaeon]|jgi:uncharacterized membrane protein|nr:small multi-drug export protein [Candidatus Woesearchaeota archaeon]MBT4835458.1 small multi-drug export protein [Candidatus Woesearchaeota archaeon]MBT6734850.1 small multi-drug export protein [Candidatus Woesearchaeota archaeon]MBT7169635.1 small multi-drug export protein [Candidatus Woesearchaeota archaeon]MBT7474593.1 small multi-drug export protein [Candidatus Woesearchaeota archaeon]